jgi:acyl-CoA synthetase (AMP-forming)/AMP-acid ligase II
MAVIDFFDRGWRQNPTGIAYVAGSREWTFDDAGTTSCQVANALLRDGFAKQTKAAVLCQNDPVAWFCVLGIWRAGLTWVPLNPASPTPHNLHLIRSFDAEVVFFHSSLGTEVRAMRPGLPTVRQFVCINAEIDDFPSLATWTEGTPTTSPPVEYDMDDVVAITPTGGTTGLPRGAMNTHRTFSVCFAHLMMAFQYGSDERIVNLAAAPMTHAAGVLSMPASARGGTVVILERAERTHILDAIERHRVTELFLPPTVIYRLLDTPGIRRRNFGSLRYLMYAAAPMSVEKLRRAIDVFGPVLMECYGQVEAFAAISYLRPEEHFVDGQVAPDSRLSSCGRPYPLISVAILDEDGQPVPAGDKGEICVRGDLVMKGYYNAPEKTAETIVDGWLHTGDVGHLDEDGYLHITDRKKDLIISGGVNVYPQEIEQVIWSHPAVQDCVVIGVPDLEWGEAVKAVVELNDGMRVSDSELMALCKKRLGSVKAPKSVDFVSMLPRSPNGKVLKREVRERYWAGRENRV